MNRKLDKLYEMTVSKHWTRSGGGFVAKSCLTLMTPWAEAFQAPLSRGFSRQEYWSGLPFPSPGDLPDPGIKPGSPELQADSLPTEKGLQNVYVYQVITLHTILEFYLSIIHQKTGGERRGSIAVWKLGSQRALSDSFLLLLILWKICLPLLNTADLGN